MPLVVILSVTLGPRVLDHKIMNFGAAGIAMIFLLVGFSLLASFFFRPFVLRPIREFSGKTDRYDGLWDEQLDG